MARRRRLRLGKLAIRRMLQRNITVADVLAALASPVRERPGNRRGTLETYGTTAAGRPFSVLTADERTYVLTVALVEEP